MCSEGQGLTTYTPLRKLCNTMGEMSESLSTSSPDNGGLQAPSPEDWTLPPRLSAPAKRSKLPLVGVAVAALIVGAAGGFLVGHKNSSKAVSTVSAAPTTAAVGASPTTAVLKGNDALLQQALTLHSTGKMDEALVIYKKVLASDAKNKLALYNIAQIAQTKGDLAGAVAGYNAALAQDPQYFPALYNIGLAYAAQGDRAAAIASLRKAVEINPKSAPAKFNLGKVLAADGQTDEGAKMVAEALVLDPSLKPAG